MPARVTHPIEHRATFGLGPNPNPYLDRNSHHTPHAYIATRPITYRRTNRRANYHAHSSSQHSHHPRTIPSIGHG
jgi:hypothetical protein